MDKNTKCSALVLAAGKGTRMKSSEPKVMQPLLEEPMLFYVLRALQEAGIRDIAVVVGYKGECVEQWLSRNEPDVQVLWQREQLGTGHAVMCAAEWLKERENVLVVNGDMPMIAAEDLRFFLQKAENADIAFMTTEMASPAGYGRVVRKNGAVSIVEAKDATAEELQITEINVGTYYFRVPSLLSGLQTLTAENAQREYYIVDLIAWGGAQGLAVAPVKMDSENLDGVNNPLELSRLSVKMRDRVLEKWLLKGIKCVDPGSVWISPRVEFQGEVLIYPNVQLWGRSVIGNGCVIQSGTILRDCVLRDRVQCLGYVVAQNVTAENNVQMGPFCFLRDGTHLLENSFAGKFVEIKNSEIGRGTKVPHLSYMGDAVIGEGTNIGAASVTCNYDGVHKNKTHIGSHVFVGSDTMLVAPVTIGDNAVIGAGSVITRDVPAGALGLARERQVIKEAWAQKNFKK